MRMWTSNWPRKATFGFCGKIYTLTSKISGKPLYFGNSKMIFITLWLLHLMAGKWKNFLFHFLDLVSPNCKFKWESCLTIRHLTHWTSVGIESNCPDLYFIPFFFFSKILKVKKSVFTKANFEPKIIKEASIFSFLNLWRFWNRIHFFFFLQKP